MRLGLVWDRIRCVVFDFDGTLVDSNAIKRNAYFDALAGVRGSRQAVEETLRELPDADRHGVLARVHARLAEHGSPGLPSVAELVARYSQRCEADVIACPALPGAVETLDSLSRELPLYLASATPQDALVRVVEGRGWSGYFRGVFGRPRSKPENLERVRLAEELEPDELVYVGDGEADRQAAESVGCPFLGHGSDPAEAPENLPRALATLLHTITRAPGWTHPARAR